MSSSAACLSTGLSLGGPPGAGGITFFGGASLPHAPCHPSPAFSPHSASRRHIISCEFRSGSSEPAATGTSGWPHSSTIFKVWYTAWSSQASPATTPIPTTSMSGASSSMAMDTESVPPGPDVSWSMKTLILSAPKAGPAKRSATLNARPDRRMLRIEGPPFGSAKPTGSERRRSRQGI